MSDKPKAKQVVWIGSSLEDLRDFPEDVRGEVGHALYQAQIGQKSPLARPMKGFHGASVLEIIDDFQTDTYRAVYTVKFAGLVYVLHAFQKKSKRGIETPKSDIELIKKRLKAAEQDYQERRERKEGNERQN